MRDRASWTVQNEAILSELVILMDIGSDEAQRMMALRPHAETLAPALSEAFYARLLSHANTAEYLPDAMIPHLHTTLRTWFLELFDGVYDEDYARRRLRIGHVHVERGVPVRYPLAMMDVLVDFGMRVAEQSDAPDQAKAAIRKLLALDLAIFNQAYEDYQLYHLTDLVGGERLARLLLAGGG